MASFWEVVDKAIWDSDVVLIVLDSRMVAESRNREIEDKVLSLEKPVIYVLTKCDLVGKDQSEKWKKKLKPCVFVSARERLGLGKLRERILIEAQRAGVTKKTVRVGVLGYPNVGKSSLANAMKGRKSAPVSPRSGFTRGVQKVRADKRIAFLDTPGVIPYQERDEAKHGMIASRDFSDLRDPVKVASTLMKRHPGRIESFFGVKEKKDREKVLEDIAVKKMLLLKGGVPDVKRAARMVVKAWQRGEIRLSGS